jgi:hypothetical protein
MAYRWHRPHTGGMGHKLGAVLGVILAAWLAFTAIGWIVAMAKTFFIIGLIAVVVVLVVWVLAGRRGAPGRPRTPG